MRAAGLSIVLALVAGHARAGEAPCWFENGAIVVPAAFGDTAGDFILDPSTARSALHVTVAGAAGIEGAHARGTLRLAGQRLNGFDVDIADLDARGRGFVTGISGVIGADALAGFVIDITTAPCRISLGRSAGGPLAGAHRAPLRRIAGVFAVRAAISDGETSRSGWFAVDTASMGAHIADARLTRRPATQADAAPARLRALSVAGLLFEATPAGLATAPPAGLDGAFGEAVWSRYRLRLNLGSGWLELADP